jgi:hypothetical protein
MALTVGILLPPLVHAADPPRAEDVECEARFLDGTTVRRAVLREGIELQTKYGKLTVPVADIRRIEFGHHVSPEAAKKIDAAVKDLGGDRFEQREQASQALLRLGRQAYPALEKAAQSGDKEVAQRARDALARIREELPEEQLQFKHEDVIYTRDSVLAGRILNPTLKAKTHNFGELQFDLATLASLHSMAGTKADLSVEAAPFGKEVLGKWIDSGLTVDADTDLVITATGQVDLVPQQAGQFVSGPEGHPQGPLPSGYLAGTLLGRVGEKGEFFVIGKRFEGRVVAPGKLYLHILPTGAGEGSSGAYKVKVQNGYDLGVMKKLAPALGAGAPSVSAYPTGSPSGRPLTVIPVPPAPPGGTAPPPTVIPAASPRDDRPRGDRPAAPAPPPVRGQG